MTPAVGAIVGAVVVGGVTYLVEGKAGPAALGAAAGAAGGYVVATKFFPDDFIVHPAAGANPAFAEYSPTGLVKARARLAALTISGGASAGLDMTKATTNGAVLNLALPITQGLPDANAQLATLLQGLSLASGATGPSNVWLESVAYSSMVVSPPSVVLPAPFALLTNTQKGWT